VDTTAADEATAYVAVFIGTGALSVTKTDNCAAGVSRNAVCAINLANAGTYSNQQEDVIVWATLTGPSGCCYKAGVLGTTTTVKGFAVDGAGNWQVKFFPLVAGSYTWTLAMGANPSSGSKEYYTTSGSFTASASANHGHLRINPSNVFNMIDDGSGLPVLLVGEQNEPQGSTALVTGNITDITNTFPDADSTPPGWTKGISTYYAAFGFGGGFNLDRLNGTAICLKATCYNQSGNKNVYDYTQAGLFDQWISAVLSNGFYQQLSPQQLGTNLYMTSGDPLADDLGTRKYLDIAEYHTARYGWAISIIEILNEVNTPAAQVMNVIGRWHHEHSPYRPLVTISWQGGTGANGSNVDITSPHHYESSQQGTQTAPVSLSVDNDYVTSAATGITNNPNKPNQFSEMGDGCSAANAGFVGYDWYERSRWRIIAWSQALQNWSTIVPFLTSALYGRFCTSASGITNMLLTGFEHQEAVSLQTLFSYLYGDEQISTPTFTQPGGQSIRRYAMTGANAIALYFHHYSNHSSVVTGQTVTVTVPNSGMHGWWIDPCNGSVISSFSPSSGSQTLTVPDYYIDIAGVITSKTLPTISVSPAGLTSCSQGVPAYPAQAGVAYSQTLTASGGTGPYTFTLASGSLPSGLSLSSAGVISGTPSSSIAVSQEFQFTVNIADSASHTLSVPYVLLVGFYQPNQPNYVSITNSDPSNVLVLTNQEFDCTWNQGAFPSGSFPAPRTVPTRSQTNSGWVFQRWTVTINSTWPDSSARSVTVQANQITVNKSTTLQIGFFGNSTFTAGLNGNGGYTGGSPMNNTYNCVQVSVVTPSTISGAVSSIGAVVR
jgi:hypothetical protein